MDSLALLNRWQHGFPLVPAPFSAIAEALGSSEPEVIAACREAHDSGALSRIGGVWAAGAGGAALLVAMAVPSERLEAVAAQVDALPGVNHNYEREHRFNLWFVITGPDAATLHARLDALEREVDLATLRLPMRKVYRIDLGFDLRGLAGAEPAELHVDITRSKPIDDNHFSAELSTIVENSFNIQLAQLFDGIE